MLLTAAVPLLTACTGGLLGTHDHGKVVGELAIPFTPGQAGNRVTIPVHVKPGERFSIKVHTSDGPFWWTQLAKPDPSLVKLAGDFNEGSCPTGAVGCRVPFFHTLIARHAGSTTMTWEYHAPSCQATPSAGSPGCTPSATVTFDITIG